MNQRIVIFLSLAALLLTACGYKGPLVLPEKTTVESDKTDTDKNKKTR